MGSTAPSSSSDISKSLQTLVTTTLHEDYSDLIAYVTVEEMHLVVKGMPNNKSPGPNRFTSEFFKATWDIIGDLVASVVQEFFKTGMLLKEFNANVITLVPKCHNPTKNYRIQAYFLLQCDLQNYLKDSCQQTEEMFAFTH